MILYNKHYVRMQIVIEIKNVKWIDKKQEI